jgi:DNA invertase Pin-like site-specific DNA recombinase/ribosomal protein L34E
MPRRRRSVQPVALGPGSEVWAYLRVSSQQQADKGLPIEGQRHAIQAYCSERGLSLSREYADEAISGSTDHREQFQRLVIDAQQGRPAAIVMWSWSRFSRDQNDAAFYKALLRRQGIQILTIEESLPHVDGLENVLEAMIHWRDEQYLRQLSANVRRGMRLLAQMGYLPTPAGSVPHGYRAIPIETEINGKTRTVYRMELDPETAPRVRRAYDMRLAGATYQQIQDAVALFAQMPSYYVLFRNPTYRGQYMWRDIAIPVPAIVSESEWQQVYDGLAHGRGGAYPRRKASQFLLSGIATCGECGATLNGNTQRHRSGRVYRYYRCQRYRPSGGTSCDGPVVRAERLEQAVVAAVCEHALSPEAITRYREKLLNESGSEQSAARVLLDGLERKRAEAASSVDNLLRAIETTPDNELLAKRLSRRTDELAAIERELTAARAHIEDLRHRELPDVQILRRRLGEALVGDSVAAAREVLREYIWTVKVWHDGRVQVVCRPPFP